MSTAAQSMSILMMACVVPFVVLGTYAFLNLEKPGARGFLLCQVGAIGWTVQLALLAWPTQIMPVHLNTAGRLAFQFVLMLGWLLLVWEYSKRTRIRPRLSVVAALLVIPVITVTLAVTNPWHHLVLAADSPANPAGISEFQIGPWYLVFVLYAAAVVVAPAGLLLNDLLSAQDSHRNQLILLLAGAAIAFPGALQTYVFRNIDAIPPYFDLTPLVFAVSAVLWGLALFRYHLLGLVPVSRHKTVETMADPVIAVDGNRTVVDANPAARQLFGATRETTVAGTSLSEFCQKYPELLSAVEMEGIRNEEIALDTDDGRRYFSLEVQPIQQGGSVLVLREVTQLRERERELDLLKQLHSRVLRHNIRNQLTVLQGYTYDIEQRDETGTFEETTTVLRETADKLLEHSNKATELRNIVDAGTPDILISLTATTREEVTQFWVEYPDITVETRLEPDVEVCTHPKLGRVIEELLQNAVDHSPDDHHDLCLRITVSARGDEGVLTVEDNGPGIGKTEIETLEAGEETALQHGSGIGLWMVWLLAEKSDGTLRVDRETDLGGTRVELCLPLADEC